MSTVLGIIALLGTAGSQFNNPPAVDIWCGKAYRPTNASFNPGGWFIEPTESNVPLLDFRISPRLSLYLDGEETGSFLVDSTISTYLGNPLPQDFHEHKVTNQTLGIEFYVNGNASQPFQKSAIVLGERRAEVTFNLSSIATSLVPHNITAVARLKGSNATFEATTLVSKLPRRTDNGTAVRLDNLYGGLAVLKANGTAWHSIFPYTYYGEYTL
jgi:hypothetical protein